MRFKALGAAVVAVIGALAVTSAASAHSNSQSVRLVNHGAITGSQVRQFTNAARTVVNGMGDEWGSPRLKWTSRHNSWTIDLYNRIGPVVSVCGEGVAGCHYTKHGVPHAVIDTSRVDTGSIWSVTGTHELEEMWVDPHGKNLTGMNDGSGDRWLVEVSDPVEDLHHGVGGMQVSDYVYPDWYRNIDGQHDAMNVLDQHTGFETWDLSCPTGYAAYKSRGRWTLFSGGCSGGMRSINGDAKRGSSVRAQNPVQRHGDLTVI